MDPSRPAAASERPGGGGFALRTGTQSFVPRSLTRTSALAGVALFSSFKQAETPATLKIVLHYKTALCVEFQNSGVCSKAPNVAACMYFHSAEDHRRPPFEGETLAYYSEYCTAISQGRPCELGSRCKNSHNQFENLFHPAKYKTGLCKGTCLPNTPCPFAHNESERRNPAHLQLYLPAAVPLQAHLPHPTMLLTSPQTGMKDYRRGPTTYPLHLDLNAFKIGRCGLKYQHNQKRCPYFHTPADRRRVPVNYLVERCEHERQMGRCPLNELCTKSHNIVEQLYHPDKYKMKMCQKYPDKLAECEFGEYCSFAHSEEDLRIEVIHNYPKDTTFYLQYFKTEWCPFEHDHNRSICVYAHNWQDYRRKLSIYVYSSDMCSSWPPQSIIREYREGCPREYSCPFSHGWKEHLYHPHSYKTTPCKDIARCRQAPECPFYHSSADRRYPPIDSSLPSRPSPSPISYSTSGSGSTSASAAASVSKFPPDPYSFMPPVLPQPLYPGDRSRSDPTPARIRWDINKSSAPGYSAFVLCLSKPTAATPSSSRGSRRRLATEDRQVWGLECGFADGDDERG